MKRVLILFFVLISPFSLFAQDWEWQNPLPTGNDLSSVHFADSSTGWTVGEFGTLLHTTDGGTTWGTQTSGTMSNLSSVFFTDPNTGWIVGAGGTLRHTTDGGTTWVAQSSGTTSLLTSIFFIDPSTGWAAGGGGTIVHTTDGGSNWSSQASGTTKGLSIIFFNDFTDPNMGWAAGSDGTILHTTDGGTTWTPQASGTSNLVSSIFFTDPNTGWASGDNGTILYTADGGATWMPQTSGTTNLLKSIFFADPTTGWAVGEAHTILHTTDGGLTWVPQSGGPFLHIDTTPLTFVFFTSPSTGWVVGDIGTILHTTDGGAMWDDQTSERRYHLPSIFFIDPNKGWAVGDPGIILHSTDGGASWVHQTTGVTNHGYSVVFTDPDTGWMTAGRGTILHTTNGGTNWTPQTSGSLLNLYSIAFTDPNRGWTVGDLGTIVHTTDGGITWAAQISGVSQHLFAVSFADSNTGWAAGQNGVILHTTNGGTTWTPQTSGTTRTLLSVFFTDLNTGWVAGTFGTIHHTTNGGTTWTAQTSGTTTGLQSVFFADPNTGWAAGLLGLMLYTTNGGTTWIAQTSGSSSDFDRVFFLDGNTGWVVGEDGNILHTTTGGTGIEPPLPTTLSSPSNGSTVSTNPILNWNPAPGAQWYNLQLSTSPYFTTYELNVSNIFGTSFPLSGLQADNSFYWRVSMTDNAGTSGWSEVWSFTTSNIPDQVNLLEPDDGAIVTSDSAVFLWNRSLPDVDRYWFERATDSLFTTSFVDSLESDTTQTATLLNHNQTYWWKVRAHNSYGWGQFSEVRSFLVYLGNLAPPALLSPDSGATEVSANPTLSWNPTAGAEVYTLQVSDTSDFSQLVVDEDSIGGTSFSVSGLSYNATYYWQVRASNAISTSDWSEAWSFTTMDEPIPCDSIDRFLTRCISGGTIQAKIVLLNSTQYAGEEVIISIDSVNYTATIGTNGTHSRATMQLTGQSLGDHMVALANPPGCFSPITVTCATGLAAAQKDWGWEDDWTEGEVGTDQKIPAETILFDNYPDPFNPSTTIQYALSEDAHVTIKVYNMLGQLIATLVDEVQTAGEKAVVWNGRNEGGSSVSSGIYIYRMSAVLQARPAGDFVATKRMLLVK